MSFYGGTSSTSFCLGRDPPRVACPAVGPFVSPFSLLRRIAAHIVARPREFRDRSSSKRTLHRHSLERASRDAIPGILARRSGYFMPDLAPA